MHRTSTVFLGLDYLVRAQQKEFRDGESEPGRGLEVDYEQLPNSHCCD